MTLKVARVCNLFLAGILTGNEFGGFVGFHPALYRLPTEAHASAEQEITARFGKIMPPFMVATIVSFVPVLSLTRDAARLAPRVSNRHRQRPRGLRRVGRQGGTLRLPAQ